MAAHGSDRQPLYDMTMPLALTYALADQHFERTKSVGILNVSLGLLRHLSQHPQVESLTALANPTLPLPSPAPAALQVRHYRLPLRGRLGRLFWDQWAVYSAARATGHPWLFLPKGFASFLRRCPVRVAAYVHDTIPLYYREHYPHAYPAGEAWYFSRCLQATAPAGGGGFTNTDYTRQCVQEAARRWGLSCPPVVVAGIGFDEPPAVFAHPQDRILCLTGPWPHKLARQTVDFLERWRKEEDFHGSIELVGRLPADVSAPSSSVWHTHDRLPEAVFRQLLGTARVLVYASEIEGFGMPPVEAVLAGVTPVYSDIPAHREVMDGTGCPFTNGDYASFVHAMNKARGVTQDCLTAWRTQLLARHHWNLVTARIVSALLV